MNVIFFYASLWKKFQLVILVSLLATIFCYDKENDKDYPLVIS